MQPVVAADQTDEHPLAVSKLGMEHNGHSNSPFDDEQYSIVQDRVAVNIWARSGYLKSAEWHYTVVPRQRIEYRVVLDTEPRGCAAGLFEREQQIDTPSAPEENEVELGAADEDDRTRKLETTMAIAAVAIEKFHRNALQRWLEWTFSRTVLAIRGTLPDLSLGPAQIRPSVVRKLAEEGPELRSGYKLKSLPDAKLQLLLSNECQSLGLAAEFMHRYLNRVRKAHMCSDADDSDCEINMVAALYAGRRIHANATIDYAPVVRAMVSMVQ
jgi:hypothetical protein